MDAHALMVKTVRDGPACTLILRGDLDLLETGRFLEQAALAADDLTGRLGFDLAGVPFLRVERSAPFLAGTEGCP